MTTTRNQDTFPDVDTMMKERLLEWAERCGTWLIETPDGGWYVVMWRYDGNAPVLQYAGHGLVSAYAALTHRRSAVYGPVPSLTPEIDQE